MERWRHLRGSFEEKDYRFLGLGFLIALISCREIKNPKGEID